MPLENCTRHTPRGWGACADAISVTSRQWRMCCTMLSWLSSLRLTNCVMSGGQRLGWWQSRETWHLNVRIIRRYCQRFRLTRRVKKRTLGTGQRPRVDARSSVMICYHALGTELCSPEHLLERKKAAEHETPHYCSALLRKRLLRSRAALGYMLLPFLAPRLLRKRPKGPSAGRNYILHINPGRSYEKRICHKKGQKSDKSDFGILVLIIHIIGVSKMECFNRW